MCKSSFGISFGGAAAARAPRHDMYMLLFAATALGADPRVFTAEFEGWSRHPAHSRIHHPPGSSAPGALVLRSAPHHTETHCLCDLKAPLLSLSLSLSLSLPSLSSGSSLSSVVRCPHANANTAELLYLYSVC